MKVLSFDQSSKKTGVCLFTNGEYTSSGVIDKHKIADIDTRIGEMGVAICNKINEVRPDIVIIENVQKQSAVSTVIDLARLQGFILGWCYVHDIRIEIIGPSEWRSTLHFKQGAGIKRKELKEQGINYVKNKYGLNLPEDEAESVCINDAARIKFLLDFSEDDLWEIN